MAKVIRRTPDAEVPDRRRGILKVVWGPKDANGFRHVLDSGREMAGTEQEIINGTWMLRQYGKADIKPIQYLWIKDRTAKLKAGRITSDDTQYVEQP